MSYSAVSSGVNIVTIEKDGSFKAMACAWASMVDFDNLNRIKNILKRF